MPKMNLRIETFPDTKEVAFAISIPGKQSMESRGDLSQFDAIVKAVHEWLAANGIRGTAQEFSADMARVRGEIVKDFADGTTPGS